MIKINDDVKHFARGYQRAVITDDFGDELTVNVLPNATRAYVSIGDGACVEVSHSELKALAAFFAQFI